jgi:hypothetical protein
MLLALMGKGRESRRSACAASPGCGRPRLVVSASGWALIETRCRRAWQSEVKRLPASNRFRRAPANYHRRPAGRRAGPGRHGMWTRRRGTGVPFYSWWKPRGQHACPSVCFGIGIGFDVSREFLWSSRSADPYLYPCQVRHAVLLTGFCWPHAAAALGDSLL